MNPASIAETYWQLHRQPQDAWTYELDVRPYRGEVVRWATVEFHFDFGSPNAYWPTGDPGDRTAHRRANSSTCRSCSAASSSRPTTARRPRPARHPEQAEYEELETRSASSGATASRFRFNPHFPVNTLLIMRGAVAAAARGVFERYVEAVFRHMWAEPKKMDDPEVIRAALDAAGLDAARPAGGDPGARGQGASCSRIRKPRRRAAPSARPTFFVGDEISSARTGSATSRKS